MHVIELEEQIADSKIELEKQREMNKTLEKQIEELYKRNDSMQSQVEQSLSQSHESMGKII